MDGFQALLLVSVLIGIALVVVSLISQFKGKSNENPDFDIMDNSIKAIGVSIKEADETAEELNKIAGNALSELDNKYRELLFLYNLIEEKKQELYSLNKDKSVKRAEKSNPPPKGDYLFARQQVTTLNHPRRQEIMNLQNEGASIAEIAKKLSMGQGEVKLILELERK